MRGCRYRGTIERSSSPPFYVGNCDGVVCTPAQVANSKEFATAASLTGKFPSTVQVQCAAGFHGGGDAVRSQFLVTVKVGDGNVLELVCRVLAGVYHGILLYSCIFPSL